MRTAGISEGDLVVVQDGAARAWLALVESTENGLEVLPLDGRAGGPVSSRRIVGHFKRRGDDPTLPRLVRGIVATIRRRAGVHGGQTLSEAIHGARVGAGVRAVTPQGPPAVKR